MSIIPFRNWDIMSIIYSLVASFIVIILQWTGVFKMIKGYFRNKKAISNYLNSLKEDCNSLIVVGKRKGFSLIDVYVQLDLAKSDLMSRKSDETEMPNSYVLLGGPGAGKSTTAKNAILTYLSNPNNNTVPFFIKLKDISGEQSISDFLIQKLELFGFDNPHTFVTKNLSNQNAFCILDGLDEVRPHLRKQVCDAINLFHAVYFMKCGSLIVTCRKEAYRDVPLNINTLLEVRPLSDTQIIRLAEKWPLGYPKSKSPESFFKDLSLSPRILEIARSPLLLVGGLLHYTETNLGIPEERFEYLQTMSRWLVVDWATAQGHAPDKYRNLYDRILTSLALMVHRSNRSEIPFEEAKNFVENLLPSFGYDKEESESILNFITIKTGILIKEGMMLFFAQFGLQEYFASKELFNQNIGLEIADLSPTNWWRESILLFIAQQKEPTELIMAILKKDPILAVAAIAECPTPSLSIQNQAIVICLDNIDNRNKTIQGSLVPFLRKVRDGIELKLINELEKRLTLDDEISSMVGISLASAGTFCATNLLSKHSEIWHICLKEAGILSFNFETLLVDWIKKSDDVNSIKAADLLCTRITTDRLLQLLDLIPSLTYHTKEHLSSLLLNEIINNSDPTFRTIDDKLVMISGLVPNILDIKSFLTEYNILPKNRIHTQSYYGFNILLATIVAFFFEKDGKRCTNQEIIEYFANSIFWQRNRTSLFYWLLSAISFLALSINLPVMQLTIFFLVTFAFFVFYLVPHKYFRYLQGMKYHRNTPNYFASLVIYLLGALSLLNLADYYKFINIKNVGTICFYFSSILYSIFGFVRWDSQPLRLLRSKKSLKTSLITFGFNFPINLNFIFLVTLTLTIASHKVLGNNILISSFCGYFALIYLLWLILHVRRFINFWLLIKGAERKASEKLEINFQDSQNRIFSILEDRIIY